MFRFLLHPIAVGQRYRRSHSVIRIEEIAEEAVTYRIISSILTAPGGTHTRTLTSCQDSIARGAWRWVGNLPEGF